MTADHRPILDYLTPRARRRKFSSAAAWARDVPLGWLAWLPLWAVALVLTAPAWLLAELGELDYAFGFRWDWSLALRTFFLTAALFLPGALVRRDAWHLVLMLVLAAAWSAWLVWLEARVPDVRYPYNLLTRALSLLSLLALAEWTLVRARRRATIAWMLLFVLAAACALELITVPLSLSGDLELPLRRGGHRITNFGDFLYAPLLAALAWLVIPYARTVGGDSKGGHKSASLISAAFVIVAFPLFFHFIIYPIARWSLLSGRPFVECHALAILDTRHRPHETEVMWQALSDPQWPRRSSYMNYGLRRHLINALAKRDGYSASRLAAVLREHPQRETANHAAPLLATAREYDAVPILLRYAMLGDEACADALESMVVPQAARGRLAVALNTRGALSAETRHRLAQILGRDVGGQIDAWFALYDEVAPTLATPLSPEQSAEADRIIGAFDCFGRELEKRTRLRFVPHDLVNWDAPDLEGEFQRTLVELTAPSSAPGR